MKRLNVMIMLLEPNWAADVPFRVCVNVDIIKISGTLI